MAYTYEQLRAVSDEELGKVHDRQTANVSMSVDYLLAELRRRDQARAMAASHRLAVASFWLAGMNGIVAVVAVVIAVTQ